ncbi:sporulation membrane protein YtaF [Geomicrobium sp. JCM 19039]|uniref:sporulation membrane protein YtaF n=1 Tax=Geomicrobium sp. JCM 19039 TaxID=1460636 RepID=UPI0005A9FAD5|nr:sporulation membrane protein YtaF [Geomicrobium sp. JCM 19039]
MAFAVSVDGFGVGMTYGLRKLRISMIPILLIGLCSFSAVLVSGMVANALFQYIPVAFGDYIGGSIIILIGVYAIIQAAHHSNEAGTVPSVQIKPQADEKMLKWEFKKLGLVIQILKKPTVADMDNSGSIGVKESVLLGIALSLDAFGAGFGAAILGYSMIWFALLVSVMCVSFLILGKKSGRKLANVMMFEKLAFVPGLLLICIGLINFI